MFLKKCIILLLAPIAFHADAQTGITGKWKFKAIEASASIDSASRRMVESMFGEMTLTFRADSTYHLFMMKDDRGKWRYDKVLDKIMLESDKGTESPLDLKIINDSTAQLKMSSKGGIILSRMPLTESDNILLPKPAQQLVSITPQQLAKKWWLKGKEKPGVSQEIMELAAEMIKGAFFKFDTDGTYKAEILKLEQEGSWKLQDNNQVLVLTAGGEKMIWKIKSVSDTVLELYKGNSDEVWKFSTNE